MKLKKIIATTLALAMAIVTIPATAAKADIVDSQTAFVQTEKYDITLPTTAGQKFYLDPQGLSSVAANGQSTIPTAAKGKIVGATTMTAINNSSKQVMIATKYEVKVDSSVMTVAATSSAVTNSTKPAICLVATATKLSGVATAGSIQTPGGVLTSEGTVAGASGAAVTSNYVLGEGSYQAVTKQAIDINDLDQVYDSSNYDYKMITSGGALNITLGGTCSSIADYSAFTGSNPASLNLDITFKFYKADGTTEYSGAKFTHLSNGNYVFDVTDGSLDGCTITACTMDGLDGMVAVNNNMIGLASNSTMNRIILLGTAGFITQMTPGETHVFKFSISDGRKYTITMTKQ